GPRRREKSRDSFDCKTRHHAGQIEGYCRPCRVPGIPPGGRVGREPVGALLMSLDAQGSFPFLESASSASSSAAQSRGDSSSSEARPSFYILDAYSLIFQVFHAIPEMSSPAGQPTQAVFGIFRDLLNLSRDRKPDYVAAAFDDEGPVFRSEIY